MKQAEQAALLRAKRSPPRPGSARSPTTTDQSECHSCCATLSFFSSSRSLPRCSFGGIAAGATELREILFFIFLVLFIVSLVAG